MKEATTRIGEARLPDEDIEVKEVKTVVVDVVLTMAEVERRTIVRALRVCGGNAYLAAHRLGVSYQTVRRRIIKYGITPQTDSGEPQAVILPWEEIEWFTIERAVRVCGSVEKAAQALEIGAATIFRKTKNRGQKPRSTTTGGAS